MEIGHKLTEIGEIPTDWIINNIPNLLVKKDGIKIGPFGSQLKKELLVKDGYKVYGQENVYEKNFEIGNRYINKEHFNRLKTCELKSGDLIISMMGTIGKTMIVPKNIQRGIMDSHLLRLRLNEELILPNLLQHYFTSSILLNQISKLSVGGIMDGLSSKIIKNILVYLPPNKKEQTEITTVLSDVDELISNLEKLIEKKRAIKQGAMQQLLKPKKGWAMKKLGEICDVRDGTHDSPKYINNGVMFITSKNIINATIDYKDISYISKEDANKINYRSRVDKDDILMSMIGTIGNAVHINFEPDFCIKNVALLKPRKINPKFLFQLICSPSIQKYIESKLDGGIQKFISLGVLRDLDIFIPNHEEQIKIVCILDEMDSEIVVLQQRLVKYKLIKQGMMQNLLTGKIRLNG